MIVLLSVGLLLLAVAVVVLFAMLGELASRVPRSSEAAVWTAEVKDAPRGVSPAEWPQELSDVAVAEQALLVVLSTVCNSCIAVAEELGRIPPRTLGPLGIVLSTGSSARGAEFAFRHGLNVFPVFVDDGGAWVGREFAVNSSPTALSLSHGRLMNAHSFAGAGALRELIAERQVSNQESEV